MIVNFLLLSETARLPVINSEHDAGIDFFSDEENLLSSGSRHTFLTGVAWEPYFEEREKEISHLFKIYMQIQGRSGLASKEGIAVLGGVVDEGFRGEIKIILVNTGDRDFQIRKGDKIAQGIPLVIPHVHIKLAKEISGSIRGEKGFGSSGA
jgi:dUTP pyrophosphatase